MTYSVAIADGIFSEKVKLDFVIWQGAHVLNTQAAAANCEPHVSKHKEGQDKFRPVSASSSESFSPPARSASLSIK